MKKILAAAGIGAALAVGLAGAPTASAMTDDEADFVADMHDLGISNPSQEILRAGHQICTDLGGGYSASQIRQKITYYDDRVSDEDARKEIYGAVYALCPERIHGLPGAGAW